MESDEFKFKSYELDGAGNEMLPLFVAEQILVKPFSLADGTGLLVRSVPDATTGEAIESQWFFTVDQTQWLVHNLQTCLDVLDESLQSKMSLIKACNRKNNQRKSGRNWLRYHEWTPPVAKESTWTTCTS